jgi:hypothetical protein
MTTITIETSCGKQITQAVSDLSDRQLRGLLEHNSEETGATPEELAALRGELERRDQREQRFAEHGVHMTGNLPEFIKDALDAGIKGDAA